MNITISDAGKDGSRTLTVSDAGGDIYTCAVESVAQGNKFANIGLREGWDSDKIPQLKPKK